MSQTENKHQRGARGAIYAMTFIMGGCGIAYEYTFSKISADLLGNSVHQWAITIGLMMLFMGIGSDLQKHIRDEALFDKFILFEILLALIGAFGPVLLLFSFGEHRDHYVLVQYGATISVGFLIGLEIPILTRINETYVPELAVNLGGVLRMDYIGAFAGALMWVFVLPRFFTLTQMSFVLGVFNLFCALLALLWFRRLTHRPTVVFGATLLATAGLIVGLVKAPQWSAQAEQWLYLDPIIYSNTTKYQHIVMTKSPSGSLYCYINGNTQFSSFDEHIYHEMLVHPAMALAPRRKDVLVLGGGDGLAMREILKYPDVETITLVDLDPGMTDLARENPALVELNHGSLLNARVKILENGALRESTEKRTIHTPNRTDWFAKNEAPVAEVSLVNLDAALFVDQIQGSYDVIVVDFPDPNNLELSKLYAQSFYTRLRQKLNRDGVLVQQATSPVHSREAFLCIGRTLVASGFTALPYHENVPTFGDWGFWLAGRDDNEAAHRLGEQVTALTEIPVPVRHITPDLMRASLVFGKDSLRTEETDINTIINNVIFRYYADALAY